MKRIISTFVFLFLLNVTAQDHYEGKFRLGQESTNQWYKLAVFDFTDNSTYNSVNVNAEINFVRTQERGYTAKVQLIMREGPTSLNGRWNYTLMGTQMDDAVKFKKISPSVFELYAKSSGGGFGHLSIEMSVTKEQLMIVDVPSSTTLIANPETYEDVPKSGNFSFISGNVGIGTWNPDSKLAVNGKVHAKEVKVDVVGWSDFVFEKDYDLPTLEEVEQHIKEKGHLKDIPSAKEVEENGVYLGEMDAKLLQKIEELTLYIIEQERQIMQQQSINKNLDAKRLEQKNEIKKLKEKNKELELRLDNLEKLIIRN
ncbi:hypothetical protein OOZ15_05275 [Galbibacter sp. EGI 63066]|uniref:hypothetical protein n=1 Tax=Galbibacter sp. EGI 63066 TaxID=2993559 RepID=UPI002248A55E|nr:hypothetical protein [Galbibacter sp. EGI 63066]MCX2679347.1 hypothetical protein [Galbibacter sp. EGI 63066]